MCLVAWAALPACGGQVHDVPDAGPDAGPDASPAPVDAAVVLAPCHAGDPPATLVTGLSAYVFNGMTTDGTRLYIAQGTAPLLWSMDARGGPATALYGSNVTNESLATPGSPALLPAAGGLFFDTLVDPGDSLSWVSDTGGPVKTVSTAYVAMFDWSGTRGFRWVRTADGVTLSTVSLADGSLTPFASTTTKASVANVLATTRFIHVILEDATPQTRFVDRRIDLANGTVHDEVVLHAGNSGIVAGPNVICELASDALGLSCLADDQAQDTYIPVASSSTAPFARYVDADWVYAEVYRGPSQLSRFSLADGHEEVLLTGAHPGAVTSFGDCVYAAMVTYSGKVEPSTAIWRFSPPR